jgi:hypothetical protein
LRDYKKSLFRFGNLSVPWGPSLGAACDKARELGVDSLRGLKTRLSQAGNDVPIRFFGKSLQRDNAQIALGAEG